MQKLFSEKGMSLASVTIAAGLMATLGIFNISVEVLRIPLRCI